VIAAIAICKSQFLRSPAMGRALACGIASTHMNPMPVTTLMSWLGLALSLLLIAAICLNI
jgi:hypothetical protein